MLDACTSSELSGVAAAAGLCSSVASPPGAACRPTLSLYCLAAAMRARTSCCAESLSDGVPLASQLISCERLLCLLAGESRQPALLRVIGRFVTTADGRGKPWPLSIVWSIKCCSNSKW